MSLNELLVPGVKPWANLVVNQVSSLKGLIQPAAATTSVSLTVAQSGSQIVVPAQTGNCAYVLPALASSAGVYYDLVISSTLTAGKTVTITAPSAIAQLCALDGMVASGTLAGKSAINKTNVILTNPAQGDRVKILCDGTNYYVQALCSAASTISSS